MNGSRKRNCYDIYADVLSFLTRVREARITRVARYSNLPVDRARKVLEEMAAAGLIAAEPRGGYVAYRATARGYEYLQLYRRLRRLVPL